MTKKTLVITRQNTVRDESGNIQENHVNWTLTIRGDQKELQKKIDKVLRTGRSEYIETEQKSVLVMTKSLIENSLVYFVEAE